LSSKTNLSNNKETKNGIKEAKKKLLKKDNFTGNFDGFHFQSRLAQFHSESATFH